MRVSYDAGGSRRSDFRRLAAGAAGALKPAVSRSQEELPKPSGNNESKLISLAKKNLVPGTGIEPARLLGIGS